MFPPKIIFILGMHRSGTSALCHTLHDFGVFFGHSFLETLSDVNPLGFWEHKTCVDINEQILELLDLQWYDIRQVQDNWWQDRKFNKIKNKIRQFIATDFAENNLIGLKDPRLCRVFPVWRDALQNSTCELSVVLLYRNPEEVALSLHKRDALARDYSYLLWILYVLEAEKYATGLPVVRFTFDQLLSDWSILYKLITEQLSCELDADIKAIGSKLERHLLKKHKHHNVAVCKHRTPSTSDFFSLSSSIYSLFGNSPSHQDTDLELSRLTKEFDNAVLINRAFVDALSGQNRLYIENRQKLFSLGKQHSHALSVVKKRDEQLSTINTKLSTLGQEHSYALEIINERDTQLAALNKECEELFRKIKTPWGYVGLLYERYKKRHQQQETHLSHPSIIDVVVPIYNGFEDLKICLNSVFSATNQITVNLILIDDASPDEQVKPYLALVAQNHENVELLENSKNVGFVATVNRGMKHHPDRDILLLNTDTIVLDGWLDKIITAAYQDEKIATVTPFSNNATICSFPNFCEENKIPSVFPLRALDQSLEKANKGKTLSLPTGVGFCMYIRRQALDETGYFDEETFGRGYGEENDFCMRAAQNGWDNKLCLDTYVHHSGGVSFGDEKLERVENAIRNLSQRYPDYEHKVQAFISRDPVRKYRLNGLIELLHEILSPKILLISHNLGGGTREHLNELVSYLNDQACFLLLTPETEYSYKLSFEFGNSVQFLTINIRERFDDFVALLKYVNISFLHYHHTMDIVPKILNLPEKLKLPYCITLHDYYNINANPSQTDIDGVFCEDKETRDSRCQKRYPLPHANANQWRANQATFLSKAKKVFVPSHYVKNYFIEYFPYLNITVAYHPEWEKNFPYPDVTPIAPTNKQKMRILVHGAISKEKGADILERCAVCADKNNRPFEFHLLGYAYKKLKPSVMEHGAYKPEEVITAIKTINPHLIWFPAIWPETYSYTLSEALMCGLPVIAPDIGSFPERLENRPASWIVPWNQTVDERIDFFEKLRNELSELAVNGPIPWQEQPTSNALFNYKEDYLGQSSAAPSADFFESSSFVEHCLQEGVNVLHFKEKMLLHLLKVKHNPIIRFCVEQTPEPLIQKVKSLFTERTFEDIETKGGGQHYISIHIRFY
jgi:GT2 family glycosyltransferase